MEKEELKITEAQEPVFNEARYKKHFVLSFSLFFFFAATYFIAAIVTTRELKTIAAINILGLPLALYLGMIVLIVGVAVTRLYLMKISKGGG